VIGELVPKRIALAAPERIASRLARPIESMSRASRPIVNLFAVVTDFLLRIFRVKIRASPTVSEEEVRALLREGTDAGIFHKDEPRMVASVLAFDRMPVSEIMTPRDRLSCLAVDDTHETLWHKVVVTGHSNYPVCAPDRDYVIGIVSVKSVYASLASGARASVRDLMAAPLFVGPNESVLGLLGHFRQSGVHVAVVRDADGRVKGFVTLVDVLEAIVGDIPALEERLRPQARARPDGSWLIDGQYSLSRLAELFGAPVPARTTDGCGTLAALAIQELSGRPREGDVFHCAGLRFEILDMDRTSVDKLLVQPQAAPATIRVMPPPAKAAPA